MLDDYRTSVLADAPKAFYLLDLADLPVGGLPGDLTGHGYDATSSDGNPTTNITYYASFGIRSATMGVRFANSEFVAPVVPTPASWTVECWMQSRSVSSGNYIVWYNGHETGSAGGDGYGICFSNSGNITICANGFNSTPSPAPLIPTDGAWHQIVVGFDSSVHGAYFWLDGSPVGSPPYTSWVGSPPAPPALGAMYLGKNEGASFTAASVTLGGVAVWGSLLTNAKVTAHYNAMLAWPAAIYDYWSFVNPGPGVQWPAAGRVTVV